MFPLLYISHSYVFLLPSVSHQTPPISVHLTLFHLGFKDKWEDFSSSWKLSVKSQGFTRMQESTGPAAHPQFSPLLFSPRLPPYQVFVDSAERNSPIQPRLTPLDEENSSPWCKYCSYSVTWFKKEGCILIRNSTVTTDAWRTRWRERNKEQLAGSYRTFLSLTNRNNNKNKDEKFDFTPVEMLTANN